MSSPRAERPGRTLVTVCFAVLANCREIPGGRPPVRSGRGVRAIRHSLVRLLTCDHSSQLLQYAVDIRQDSHLVTDSTRGLGKGVVR